MIIPAATALLLSACAARQPHPTVDPTKQQITILQKQLLELQNIQNETRLKIDQQTAATEALSARIKSLEEQREARLSPASSPEQSIAPKKTSPPSAAVKQKPVKNPPKKKKKTVRRKTP